MSDATGNSKSLPEDLLSVQVDEFTDDSRFRSCCYHAGIKTVGEFFALGRQGRMALKYYGSKSEESFQKALLIHLHARNKLWQQAGVSPDSHNARQDAGVAEARICAALYLARTATTPLPPLDLSWDHGPGTHSLRIALERADIRSLLVFSRALDLPESVLGGTDKAQFLTACPSHTVRQAETELYKIARAILPISIWGPELWNKYIPSWVLSTSVRDKVLDGRILSVCTKQKLTTFRDMLSVKDRLYRIAGIGRKWGQVLLQLIDDLVFVDSPNEVLSEAEIKRTPFLEYLAKTIRGFQPESRNTEIMKLYWGLDGRSPLSRAKLAAQFGVSDERIGGIESRICEILLPKNRYWMRLVAQILESALETNSGELSIAKLVEIEPWFSGVAEHATTFGRALRYMPWQSPSRAVHLSRNGTVLNWKHRS